MPRAPIPWSSARRCRGQARRRMRVALPRLRQGRRRASSRPSRAPRSRIRERGPVHRRARERAAPPASCSRRQLYETVLARSARAEDLFDLPLDLLEVHELAINRGEADVCDFVQVAQAVHHHLADLPAWDLHPAGAPQLRLDVVDDRAQPLGRDIALFGRLLEAGEELLRVEVLAATVLFGDVKGHRFDARTDRKSTRLTPVTVKSRMPSSA